MTAGEPVNDVTSATRLGKSCRKKKYTYMYIRRTEEQEEGEQEEEEQNTSAKMNEHSA
jgi:hypothetical protein